MVNDQVKDFLSLNNILSPFQSGFRKQHSSATAAIKVINDIVEAMDAKKYCAALFIDLSKARHLIQLIRVFYVSDCLPLECQTMLLDGSPTTFPAASSVCSPMVLALGS